MKIISAPDGAVARVVRDYIAEGRTTALYQEGTRLFVARATAEDLKALRAVGIVVEEIT